MFPNPQDALPLPSRPRLDQYRKLAKDLVRACAAGDSAAIQAWASRWIESLARNQPDLLKDGAATARSTSQVTAFAREKLSRPGRACRLADAQFVLARSHGFDTWSRFVTHVAELERRDSPTDAFEAAADAIVTGQLETLDRLLREHPGLIGNRSTREHRATLLHYVSANGVENYRQRTPPNIVGIAERLLRAGAEVDDEANVYGGGATTLGLVATSAHPRHAGVQNELIDLLLTHGARKDLRGAGNGQGIVNGCLHNGCPEAALHLVNRGAPVDLEAATGVGRLDLVRTFFDQNGGPSHATSADLLSAFSLAAGYGHPDVAAYLLDRGVAVNAGLSLVGQGHTALHLAALRGDVDVVRLLLSRGAALDVRDDTWHTAPITWAVHAWRHEPHAPPERYVEVVRLLVAAGAAVPEGLPDEVRNDPAMHTALSGR